MRILTKYPVMAKRHKTWNRWILALVVIVLVMVQPSTSSTAKWGEACTVGTIDCTEGDCVDDGVKTTCGCESNKLPNHTKKCTPVAPADGCPSDMVAVWVKGGKGQICITVGGDGCASTKEATECAGDTATPFCVQTGESAGTCQVCTAGWKCPTGQECLGDGKCGKPKTCDVKDDCRSLKSEGQKECVAKADGSKFCGKGCGEYPGCMGTKPICVVPNLASQGTCLECNETLTCPSILDCESKKCVAQQAKEVVLPVSNNNMSTTMMSSTMKDGDGDGSTTANSTNSGPGMPSSTGSLILLTCAAALVLTAA